MDSLNQIIFDDKSFSDLLKEIHKNQSKKSFLKKAFVKNRVKLMKSKKLITRNNKITPIGYSVLKITNFFSILILKDDI